MKAATMNAQTGVLRYADVPTPTVTTANERLLTLRAAAIKNIDRSWASGHHYAAHTNPTETIIGSDGVGLLADGRRVYAVNPNGMVAERAVIDTTRMVTVPDELDDATAAALPNAVIGAAMALRFRAQLQPGDTVLINGATGVTGRIAVQMARQYGAGKIIATGRNPDELIELRKLGADELIALNQSDDVYLDQLRALHSQTPIDVMIDYLWGHSAALLLTAIQGNGNFTHPVRFVSVGSMAGPTLQLSSEVLRGTNLHMSGSGLGSWTRPEVRTLFRDILPETFRLAANGELTIDTVTMPLHAIEHGYDQPIPAGKRLVITML